MSTTESGFIRKSWAPAWDRLFRLWRSAAVKAVLGAQLVALVVVAARGQGWLQPLELLIYDQLRVSWAGKASTDRVVLIGANERDVGHYNWPLSDGLLADLLERLESFQPRVIGVDIYRDIPQGDPAGTERLAATLKRHPNIVWVFKLPEGSRPEVPPPALLRGTARAVLADTVDDPGRIVRRGLLFADDGKRQYTALGMALAERYLARQRIGLKPGPTEDSLQLGKAVIRPLDDTRGPYVRIDARGYQLLMDYHGGPQPFPLESIQSVMDSDGLAPLIRDRVVILGVTAESIPDSLDTPFSTGFNAHEPVWGVSIHAHVANQVIREAVDGAPSLHGLTRLWEDLWIWVWAMTGAALGLAIRSTIPAVGGAVGGVSVIGGVAYGAFGADLLLPALPASLAWLGAAFLTNQLLHSAANRSRAQLRRSFEHYLPPAVIKEMVESDSLPKLGGERREISVVFSDIASSTTLAETIDPVDLAPLMNAYFAGIGAAIFDQAGYINEFMGDGVLSFFGAPQHQPDHADLAVAAALQIAAFGDKYSTEQHERGVSFGHTRVGVHCGNAMVGNIGTPSRLKYSALGDVLNTGSRLEGLNKVIGTRVCVSDAVVKRCRRSRFRRIGEFVVKGRREPTPVYEPLDGHRYSDEHIARYGAAYDAMAAERPEAAEMFAQLHRDAPDDPCVKFHHTRLSAGEKGTLIVMTEK